MKYNPELLVHPMNKWHLYSKFQDRKIVTSDQLEFVWLYGIIDCFVLIVACINFMNLSTARSEEACEGSGYQENHGFIATTIDCAILK
ncbi:MAG: hypothetical protein WDO15_16060 [Bacteroidota bacterium]